MGSRILDALSKLDVANDNHWTAEGMPRIETVCMLAGDQSITREKITAEAPQFCRANATISEAYQPAQVAQAAPTEAGQAQADAPVSDIDRAIAEKEAQVADLKQRIEEAQAVLAGYVQELDGLIDSKVEQQGAQCTMTAVQAYLAGQRKELEDRARRNQILKEQGVTIQDIKSLLPQTSPLDQAIASKKKK